MKFYEKLKHLSPQAIGQVVTEVQTRCPSAFKEVGDDNAQLLVDNMDVKTFREVTTMMENILTGYEERVANKVKGTQ